MENEQKTVSIEIADIAKDEDLLEGVFVLIKNMKDNMTASILLDALAQGCSLINSIEETVTEETPQIDTIKLFESFFGVDLKEIFSKLEEKNKPTPEGEAKIMSFIEGSAEQSEEEIQADIKDKLSFLNSVIDR